MVSGSSQKAYFRLYWMGGTHAGTFVDSSNYNNLLPTDVQNQYKPIYASALAPDDITGIKAVIVFDARTSKRIVGRWPNAGLGCNNRARVSRAAVPELGRVHQVVQEPRDRSRGGRPPAPCDRFLLLEDFRSDEADEYPGGFLWCPHRGMEIITYVPRGEVRRAGSLVSKGMIAPGDVQRIRVGSAIIHQEIPKGGETGAMHGFKLRASLTAAPATRGLESPVL